MKRYVMRDKVTGTPCRWLTIPVPEWLPEPDEGYEWHEEEEPQGFAKMSFVEEPGPEPSEDPLIAQREHMRMMIDAAIDSGDPAQLKILLKYITGVLKEEDLT